MESQSQHPEFRSNPENFHPFLYLSTSLINCVPVILRLSIRDITLNKYGYL